MYRNHPLWAKLREICYVDKWLCHTRPFPDFKCFCTSGFFCFFFLFAQVFSIVLFLSLYSQLLKGASAPCPDMDLRRWPQIPSGHKGSKEELQVEWTQNSGYGCYHFLFPRPCYRSILCRESHRHHWLFGGEPLDHPKCHGHLHFSIPVPVIRV